MTRFTALRRGAGTWTVEGSETIVTVDRLQELVGIQPMLAHLLRYDEARLLTPSLDAVGRPLKLALLLRALSHGPCYFEDETGRRRPIGGSLLARWIGQVAAEPFKKRALLESIAGDVTVLEQHIRHRRPISLNPDARPVYLRTDISFGLQAGGSVAHIAGVLNHLAEFGGEPVFVTTDRIPTLRPDLETHVVPPAEAFWHYPELPSFVMNTEIDHAAARVIGSRPVSMVYHRYSVNSFAGASLAIRRGIPLVLEYNGSEVWISRHWGTPLKYEALSERIELANLALADLIVVVSRPMADELVARGVAADTILVNPNGVEPDRYSPAIDGAAIRDRYGLAGKTVIGFIGTFGAWHGAEVLAEAFGTLLMRHPEHRSSVRLLLIGDGVRMPDVKRALEAAGVRDAAVLTGTVPQEDGARHLAACDILVSPHVPNPDGTPFFGSPTKLFEYMAMGKGIVASHLDQIGEVLNPPGQEAAAVMVTPGDADALAAGLAALIDDPARRERLGRAARALVLERHTWRAHTARIFDALRRRLAAA